MKFPSYFRNGTRRPELLRFYCVMFASMVGREDPITFAIVIKNYIETGEQPAPLSQGDYVDRVL